MVRISQALLYGTLAVCITAMIAFAGGWRMATTLSNTSTIGIINPDASEESVSPNTDSAAVSQASEQRSLSEARTTDKPIDPSADSATAEEIEQYFAVYWEVWDLVEREFYRTEPLERQQMVYDSIRGMLHALGDEYTSFEEPKAAARTRESMRGSFEGIGALLNIQEGELVIVRPLRKSPAIQAGIQSEDVIVAIDGEDVAALMEGLSDEEALERLVQKIRGPQGSTVVLTIRRAGEPEPFDIEIVRDHVPLISVNAQMIDTVAHIQITEFRDSTPGELEEELRVLMANNPTGIVLDLRNNPGGIVDSSLRVLGYFYKGVGLYEDNSTGDSKELYAIEAPQDVQVFDVPMVVLINDRSASAAEIVAGALRERRPNTTLLGTTSFGKGSVQNVHRLSDNSSVRITIAQWFTPDRKQIHKEGITPDHVVGYTQDAAYAMPCIGDMIPPEGEESCNDSQLSWGIRFLSQGEIPPTPTPEPTVVQE